MATITVNQFVLQLQTAVAVPAGDMQQFMSVLAVRGASESKRAFNSQQSPDGQPWSPLQHPRPGGGGGLALLDTGQLRASITGQADTKQVVISSTARGAALHQSGGIVLPQRGKYLAIPLTKAAKRAGSPRLFGGRLHFRSRDKSKGGALMDAAGVGQYALVRSVTIPPRPFLGFSARFFQQAEADWAALVAKLVTGGGRGAERGGGRNAMSVLTSTDNTNGTGLVATLSDATPFGSWVLYAQRVTQFPGTFEPVYGSSDEGNGTYVFSPLLPNGTYHLYATDGVEVSDVITGRATNGDDCPHNQAMEALRSLYVSLDYPLIGGNVHKKALPDCTELDFPCVLLTVQGNGETAVGGTNERDDIGYPVRVQLCVSADIAKQADRLPWVLAWRHRFMAAVRNQPLGPLAPGIYTVQVTPEVIIDPELPLYQRVVSGFTAVCISREPRGA